MVGRGTFVCDKLASLTVLSHQAVGCVGDGFYKAPQEVEGGQEALGAMLVGELDKEGIMSQIQQLITF